MDSNTPINDSQPLSMMVTVDLKARTLDLYGGSSPYTKDDPYWISFDELKTYKGRQQWRNHLKHKKWMRAADMITLFLTFELLRTKAHL